MARLPPLECPARMTFCLRMLGKKVLLNSGGHAFEQGFPSYRSGGIFLPANDTVISPTKDNQIGIESEAVGHSRKLLCSSGLMSLIK